MKLKTILSVVFATLTVGLLQATPSSGVGSADARACIAERAERVSLIQSIEDSNPLYFENVNASHHNDIQTHYSHSSHSSHRSHYSHSSHRSSAW